MPEVLSGVAPVALPRVTGRQAKAKATPEALVLFGGPDPVGREALTWRLEALLDEPRLALVAWAQGMLVELRSLAGDEVRVHASVLAEVERCARVARLATPLSRPLLPDEVGVVVLHGPVANIVRGQVRRRADRVLSVHFAGKTERFDARTGELLGSPFTPGAPHLSAPFAP